MKVNECRITEHASCHKDDSIIDVAKKLREHKIRHVVVVDDKKHPIGIVASVDIVNHVIADGKDYKHMKARDVMISPIFTVNEQDSLQEAYAGMGKRNIFSCPVISETNEYKGMLTFVEAVKHLGKMTMQTR